MGCLCKTPAVKALNYLDTIIKCSYTKPSQELRQNLGLNDIASLKLKASTLPDTLSLSDLLVKYPELRIYEAPSPSCYPYTVTEHGPISLRPSQNRSAYGHTCSLLARYYSIQGDCVRGEAFFKEALKLNSKRDPNFDLGKTYIYMSEMHLRNKDYTNAMRFATKGLSEAIHTVEHKGSEDIQEKIDALRDAFNKSPNIDPKTYESLNWEERLELLNRPIDPDFVETLNRFKTDDDPGDIFSSVSPPKEPSEVAMGYLSIAAVLLVEGNYDLVEELYEKSIGLLDEQAESSQLSLAFAYEIYGELQKVQANHNKSEEYYMKSIRIREQCLEANHPVLAKAYMKLHNFFKLRSKMAEAHHYLVKAVKIQIDGFTPKSRELGLGLHARGDMELFQGKVIAAEKSLTRAMNILSKQFNKSKLDLALVYDSLGELYLKQRIRRKAEHYFQKAFEIREACTPVDLSIAISYINKARTQALKGAMEEASENYELGIQLLEEKFPGQTLLYECYRSYASFLFQAKDFSEAVVYLDKSIKFFEAQDPQGLKVATCYHILGGAYYDERNIDEAEKYILKALNIREALLEPGNPRILASSLVLAKIHATRSNYQAAEDLFLMALRYKSQNLDQFNPELAELYLNIGKLSMVRKDFDQAEELLLKGVEICEKAFGPAHLQTTAGYLIMRRLYLKKGDERKANDFALKLAPSAQQDDTEFS